jgi:hypothetical protein
MSGGGGETQAPTEKDRRYPSDCDKRTQLLGIEENCFVSSVAAVCRRCENYLETTVFKELDQYRAMQRAVCVQKLSVRSTVQA